MSITVSFSSHSSPTSRSQSKMSTSINSFFVVFKDGSWRPILRKYRKRILGRNKSDRKTVEGVEIIVVKEKADSGVAISCSSVGLKSEESAPEDLTEIYKEGSTHRALRVVGERQYVLQEDCPLPEFEGDEEVMIKTYAVGLNPIDWKSVDYNFCLPSFPWVTGREMAGVVHKIAPGVTRFKVGDRVWTSTYYRDIRAGCFQDHIIVPQHTVLPIPSNLSFESAACLGVGALTASMTLWKWLKVPRTPSFNRSPEKECLLIWGGSTVTGQFAVQIALQSGLEVIAVTSSKTQALVESLGAHTIARNGKTNDEIVEAIRALAGDRITRALDLVGNDTAPFCLQPLSKTKPCLFAPLAMMKTQPVPNNVEVVTVEMKQFVLDSSSTIYAEDLNSLMESGKVKLPELDILRGGLSVVLGGLVRLKEGDMGGKKMIVSWDM